MIDAPVWEVMGGTRLRPDPFFVMGVVNVTPDSFYDGGRYTDEDSALEHARGLMAEGADILDVGGESTRPFSDPVDAETEASRVLPVIRRLITLHRKHGTSVPISVDTYKADVAEHALQAGAVIVNDVSGCRFDPRLKEVVTEYKPGYVLMHSSGRPKDMQVEPVYDDVVSQTAVFFEQGMNDLIRAGLPESHIVLDPGIGFGKKLEHNIALIRNVGRFAEFGRPLMIGLSNKSMWGALLGLELEERTTATQIGTAVAAMNGVALHRVHEVAAARRTLQIATELAL